jgi:hypothetical protein
MMMMMTAMKIIFPLLINLLLLLSVVGPLYIDLMESQPYDFLLLFFPMLSATHTNENQFEILILILV